MNTRSIVRAPVALLLPLALLCGCPPQLKDPRAAVPKGGYKLSHQGIQVALDEQLRLAVARRDAKGALVELAQAKRSLFAVQVDGKLREAFHVEAAKTTVVELKGPFGEGRRFTVVAREADNAGRLRSAGTGPRGPLRSAGTGPRGPLRSAGTGPRGPLELTVELTYYKRYPKTLFTRATVKNTGKAPLAAVALLGPRLTFEAGAGSVDDRFAFAGAAVGWGKDSVFNLKPGSKRTNNLGWQPDLGGGGLPINVLWDRRGGVALGHADPGPQHVRLPLLVDDVGTATTWLAEREAGLAPGASRRGLQAFVTAHRGDFYTPIAEYREMLADQGKKPPKPPASAYEPIWCSWGYEFDVRPEEIIAILPKLKQLGLRWVVLDDRWFDRYGDWRPRPEIFGKDGAKLKKLVSAIHAQGMLAKLWWIPLVAELSGQRYPSHVYATAEVAKAHPEWLIKGADGKPVLGIRKLAYLDPTLPAVRDYTLKLTERFIREWGFDGHKLDVVFAHPPRKGAKRPEQTSAAMAAIYQAIYAKTAELKPQSVTEICPCGTTPYHAWAMAQNQAVTADPVGAVQMRRRIKLLKALLGPRFAVYADHVELTAMGKDDHEFGDDFASGVGTGAVVGTKFVWPKPKRTLKHGAARYLDPAKEKHWKRWLTLSRELDLARGRYIGGLYDVALDKPETHVVERRGKRHYAFYASKPSASFGGEVEFRGDLSAKASWEVFDLVARKVLGRVSKTQRKLKLSFRGSLLTVLR
jgi:alpha-galactosidase